MLDHAILVCALGCGLVAGVFFAFSTFVMKALGTLPSAHGIAAMQSINIVVINPWFMTAFAGTAVVSGFLAILALLRWQEPGAAYLLAGGVLYVVGSFLVTLLFNVPRNDALERAVPSSPDAERLWRDYLVTWVNWNHVRTIAALAAAASFTIALRLRA
jgi:uncharacterized membrane protein